MILYLEKFIFEVMLLLPFCSAGPQLQLMRITGKFDIVEWVPVYTRIKF
jgi:hypothetical protein